MLIWGCAFLIYALTMRTGVGILRPQAISSAIARSKRLVKLMHSSCFSNCAFRRNGGWSRCWPNLRYISTNGQHTCFQVELLSLTPWWKNLVHNPTTVQFIHRYMAKGTWLSILAIWCYFHRRKIDPALQRKFNILTGHG